MYEKNYNEYDRIPPYGRPENGPARPQDTYGHDVPPFAKHPGDAPEPYHAPADWPHHMEPGYHLLPVPPAVYGMSAEQQILALGHKVDELIETFNSYDRKIYGAHEAVVNSALHNDAYYPEITVEDGYLAETGAKYKVIHIPYVDRAGQPIFLELGLPSNSTLNEGLTENCFDASQRTLADKLIPAVNKDTGYTGLALYKHSPIENMAAPISLAPGSTGWTLGITESGYLKIYDTANTTYEDLKWDKIRNAMGVVGLLVQDGKKAASGFMSPDSTQTVARTAIGMNYHTKERFIVVVDGDEEHGCLSDQLADIFLRYHVNVAVETATQGSAFGMDKGEMVFMPPTASISLAADGYPNAPHVGAFWYITKRRHYHNDYVKEVATLMQRLGQNIWVDKIYEHAIDDVEEAVQTFQAQLDKEKADREAKDNELQTQLDAEKDTRERVDNDLYAHLHDLAGTGPELGGKIGEMKEELENKIEEEKQALTQKIEERIGDLKKFVQSEDNKIKETLESYKKALDDYDIERVDTSVDGYKRTYRLIRKDGSDVQVPIEVYDYASLVTNLGDVAAFESAFNNFKADYAEWKASIDDAVRELKNNVTSLTSRMDVTETEFAEMKGTFASIQERMSALDRTVASFQSQIVEMELAVENLKTAWAEYHTQWLQAKQEYEEWREKNKQEMEALDSRLQSAESKLQEHDKKLGVLEDSVGDLNDRATSAETRLDAVEKENHDQDLRWNAAVEDAQSRIQQLLEDSQSYWQRVDQLETKTSDWRKQELQRLGDLERENADRIDEIEKNKEGLAAEHEQTLKDAVRFAQYEMKLDELDNLDENLDGRVTALETAKTENDDKWNTQNDWNTDVSTRLEAVEGKADNTQGELESLENTVTQLDGRVDTLEEHYNSVDQKNTEQDTEIDGLKKADETLSGRIEALENNKTVDDEKDTTQDGRIEALEGQQTDLSDRLSALETEVHDINVDAYVQKAGDTMTGDLRTTGLELSDGENKAVEFKNAGGTVVKVAEADSETLVRMSGADAVEETEFVTKKQLTDEGAVIEGNANSYTDSKLAEVNVDEQIQTYLTDHLSELVQPLIQTYLTENASEAINPLIEAYWNEHSLLEKAEDGTYVRTKGGLPFAVESE